MAMHPRVWNGSPERLVIDCPRCANPAIVRDPDAAAISGKSWVDCTASCGPNEYRPVAEAAAYWVAFKARRAKIA